MSRTDKVFFQHLDSSIDHLQEAGETYSDASKTFRTIAEDMHQILRQTTNAADERQMVVESKAAKIRTAYIS